MAFKYFFIRHGQSEYNAGLSVMQDSSLTDKGVLQAQRVALFIKEFLDKDFKGFVSPFVRCLQTALPILKSTDVRFHVDSNLGEAPCYMELIQPGIKSITNRSNSYLDFDWSKIAEGSIVYDETEEAYNQRLIGFVKSLPEKSIIVSHMCPIQDMLRYLCPHDTTADMKINNASISLVEDGRPIYINQIP